MFTIKRLCCVSALAIGAVALLAMPSSAQAGPKVVVSVGVGYPVYRPAPIIIRPTPIIYPSYPVYRPVYYPPVVPVVIDRHDYDVLYRGCATDSWQVFGRFDTLRGAEQAAAGLQRGGREVTIQTIHNHR